MGTFVLPEISRWGWVRISTICALLIILIILGVSAITYTPPEAEAATIQNTSGNLTVATTQGGKTGEGAGLYVIDSETQDVVWSHTEFKRKYFDVDPLDSDRLLFIAQTGDPPWKGGDSWPFEAIIINWRTGEIIDRFPVGWDTHDVDYLGDGEFVIADKTRPPQIQDAWLEVNKRRGWVEQSRDRIAHRIYVYNRTSDRIVWEWYFADHFPATAGDGINNDYTHLNDVDPIDNGSAFLVSPREFDRVMLINRSSKGVEWVLGEEDNYDILHEQHNPNLLSRNPPTVLVADSENDRIVEYTRDGDDWIKTWVYSDGLQWPRDADRLPNGNTIIADTANQRFIEVTPEKEVVWEKQLRRGPYDIERLQYGDEPSGPAIQEIRAGPELSEPSQDTHSLSAVWDDYYFLASWILPIWMGPLDFLLVNLGGIAAVVLTGGELYHSRETIWRYYETKGIRSILMVLISIVGAAILGILAITTSPMTGVLGGIAAVLMARIVPTITDSLGFEVLAIRVTQIGLLFLAAILVVYVFRNPVARRVVLAHFAVAILLVHTATLLATKEG